MKKILLTIALATSLFAVNDNVIFNKSFYEQQDKQIHMGITATASTLGSGYCRSKGYDKFTCFIAGVGTGLLIGWVKEVSDGQGNGHRDMNDMDANALGSMLGAVVSSQFNWRF